jgi:hypothetical protein
MSTPPRLLRERPDGISSPGPKRSRTPYPVNHPGFDRPGSEPDYIPPVPPGGTPEM